MVILASVDLVDQKNRDFIHFFLICKIEDAIRAGLLFFVESKKVICSLGDSASQIALMRFIRLLSYRAIQPLSKTRARATHSI